MILIYACAIFFTLTCESLPLDREYTPNVGTVLFSTSDTQRKQWTKSEMGLLQARRYFQNLLPPPIFVNTFNEKHVNALLGYFRDAYVAVKKEAKDPETDTIMTTALSDAIGGYLKVWVLPVAKLDYYGGTISQTNVIKLFQFYNEIKRYLNTDGDGWRKPDEQTLNSITINVAPLPLASSIRSIKDPCDHLAYFEKTSNGLTIPIPNVNWNDKASTLFVPLRNATLILMNTPNSSQNLFKYYNAATSCIQTSNPTEQEIFDKKFQKWLIEEVVPHLKDENLYLALGSVLTLVNKTRDLCNTALDLYATKCEPKYEPSKKKPKSKLPCDSSHRKIWILTVILIIEIAWCVPALIFVICSKKKDCSSHVYLILDKNKKSKGDLKITSCEDGSTSGGGGAACFDEPPGEMRVIQKTVFSNTEFISQCPSSDVMTNCLPENRSGSRSSECPETYCVPKKSSLKKPSGISIKESCNLIESQIMAITSHETFGSKQSRSKSRNIFPSIIDKISKGKKKPDKDECKKHEKCKKSNDCTVRNDSRKPKESKDFKEPEESKDFKEPVESKERRKPEESKFCKKPQQRKQSDECKKLEERKKLEESKKLEERKKYEENKKLEDRKNRESMKVEDRKKLKESSKSNESIKHSTAVLRHAKEYRKPEARKQTEESKKLDQCTKRNDSTEIDNNRRLDECTEVDESELGEPTKLKESSKHKKAAICKKLEGGGKLEEYDYSTKPEELEQLDICEKVDEHGDNDERLDNEDKQEFEESYDFDENRKLHDCQLYSEEEFCDRNRKPKTCPACFDGSDPKNDDSCLMNEVKYDLPENNLDICEKCPDKEPVCCQDVSSQEKPHVAICPCSKCVNNITATNSNVTFVGMSLCVSERPSDKQDETKITRFQVTKELKGKEKVSSKHSSGKTFLEITIDRPSTGICVDMSQCRTHNSPYRPSKIPKPANCTITQSGRQPFGPADKHRSLIPQLKKKTADDMELSPCSKSVESKLNNSF